MYCFYFTSSSSSLKCGPRVANISVNFCYLIECSHLDRKKIVEKVHVLKISYQVIKLIITGFVVVQGNIKPSVLAHRPRKLGLYF